VVDVDAGDVQCLRRLEVVDDRLDAVGAVAPVEVEVVGDELALAAMLANEAGGTR
jgi:hypothetical protein